LRILRFLVLAGAAALAARALAAKPGESVPRPAA
jgi:hypothetical protein